MHLFSAEPKAGKRQTTLQFKPVDKKPKKNPWSDDESDSEDDMEMEEALPPRERVERRTKGKSLC